MRRLAILCSRNPDQLLVDTVRGLNELYSEFDIVVVDSNSTDVSTYDEIRDDVMAVHLAKNDNYEIGAYKFAYELYPDYDVYMCIQDSFCPSIKVELDNLADNQICCAPLYQGLHRCHYADFYKPSSPHQYLMDLVVGSQYEQYALDHITEGFLLVQYNSFIITKGMMEQLISCISPILPTDKNGSAFYERMFGLLFLAIAEDLEVIDVRASFTKTLADRQ